MYGAFVLLKFNSWFKHFAVACMVLFSYKNWPERMSRKAANFKFRWWKKHRKQTERM